MDGKKPGTKRTKVINLFAGPGSGKSTTAAGLFFLMKTQGYKCELVTEYAKELVYGDALHMLENQSLVLTVQAQRQSRLDGKVDFIITDSPLILSEIYVSGSDEYRRKVVERAWREFERYDNLNYFINRVKPYAPYGRTQTEEQAKALDERIQDLTAGMLDLIVDGNWQAPAYILEDIKAQL